MAFEIFYSPDGVEHLSALSKAEQVLTVDQIELQLSHEPTLVTRRRKVLRPNPIAPWVLRLGDIRVFYNVQDQPVPTVNVVAIGNKVHNELWIGGERIEL